MPAVAIQDRTGDIVDRQRCPYMPPSHPVACCAQMREPNLARTEPELA
jgi:hypothetical protein